MATDSIHVLALIPAAPQAVYDAWISSEGHAKMTGAGATIEPRVGGKHSAWDGYISGETLELEPGKRIVQTWRAADFPEGSGHSNLVVKFEEDNGQTRLVIDHTDIPGGHGERFSGGWQDFYITPMLAHFGGAAAAKPTKKTTRKAAKKTAKKAAAKRPAKKTAKKAAARKPAKKTAKKAAARKPAKKTAKKAAAKKPAKKTAKKAAAKRPAKKTAKKPARKPAKKA